MSNRQLVTPEALRAPQVERVPDDLLRQYAGQPVTTDRVRALAHAITAAAPTTYDKVLAIEEWLRTHTQYSLDIPRLPKGADAVDQYVFVDRKGFCEQIGTTLVVMLRELGIPARLAVGYAPGERNPFTGLYEVKASDAHAWAEVYFPGIGWQGFDPTANVPLAGDSQIDAAGDGAFSYLSERLHIPGELLAALSIAAGAVGLFFALRSVRRRPARISVSRSWASQRLARLESLGRAPGPTPCPERDHPDLRARVGHDRARPGRCPRTCRRHDRRRDVRARSRRTTTSSVRSMHCCAESRPTGRPRRIPATSSRAADDVPRRAVCGAAQETGTPSKTATLTPRAASSARNARGLTTRPRPCTPGRASTRSPARRRARRR